MYIGVNYSRVRLIVIIKVLVAGQVNTPSNREQSCAATALIFFLLDHKVEFIHDIVTDMT